MRLTEKAYKIGLASEARYQKLLQKKNEIEAIRTYWKETGISPALFNAPAVEQNVTGISEKTRLEKLLLRPGMTSGKLQSLLGDLPVVPENVNPESIEAAEISLKYQTYIEKEKEMALKIRELENLKIPENINYMEIPALSMEARLKLSEVKPATLGQAGRISGVNPSDIQVLLVRFGR